MTSPAIVFAGTPDFALASLKALVEGGRAPVAVYTQPDRPSGRGKRVTASPVKQYASELGLPVLQPRTLRTDEAAAELAAFKPDLLVVAAYGLLLPQAILDVPSAGCVNVHASILPRWRGAAPIQAAILAGDEASGISLMSMTAGLDTGPVFASEALPIAANETAGSLHDRLAALGGTLLMRHVDEIAAGALDAAEQDDSRATYASKIQTEDARLDWQAAAIELDRKVRAFNPVPGSFFDVDGQRIKCWAATPLADVDAPAGTVVSADRSGIVVACGVGALRLETLQRPGKGRVSAQQFLDAMDLSGRTLAA